MRRVYLRAIRAYIAYISRVQKIELFTLIRMTISRVAQSALSLTRRHWQRVVSLDRSIRPTSFFILCGNSNIVTPLNAFMETFLARNVHFTFIMFAQWMWRMFGLIVMTKSERSVHLHGQSLWLLSNLNVLADYFSADQHYECWKHTRHTMWSYLTRLSLFMSL